MKHFFVLLTFIFSFTDLVVAQTQETTKITATLVRLSDSTIAVDFVVLAGANLSGSALPLSVLLRIPTSLGPTTSTITLASSNFGLTLAQATDDGAGYFIYYYQSPLSIDLSTSTWDDGMVVRVGVFNVTSQPDNVSLSGGQYGPPVDNGPGYTWSGTALLTNNTETNLVTWPISASVSLPIRLTNFSLIKTANSARIDWTTLSELNSDHFDIQRSYDTKDWTTIGTVVAAGSSSTRKTYTYLDKNLPTKNRIIYYRIKAVDLSQFFTFTETKSIQFGQGSSFNLINTLVRDRLYLQYQDINDKNIEFRIVDMQGKVHLVNIISLDGTSGTIEFTQGINTLPVGVYHLFSPNPGFSQASIRFVKTGI